MADWSEITGAIGVALTGDRVEGRRRLLDCWWATDDTEHAKRCVLAHYLADLEPDLADEVRWDERALEAHPHVTDADLAPVGIASAAALAPSLHLNLGDGYLRQGEVERARAQVEAGLTAARVLGDDGYGDMIRTGLDRLAQRLGEVEAAGR